MSEDLKVGLEFDENGFLKLREAFQKVAKENENLRGSTVRANGNLADMDKQARMTANGLRQLPAQLSDISVQLAGGQSPFLIMLQQGSQIRDAFGGVGAAIRGVGSVLNPAALGIGAVVTAVGGFAYAAYQGMKDAEAFKNALLLTGNAAGLTAGSFDSLGKAIADASGVGIGQGKAALLALAQTGAFTGENLKLLGQNVIRTSELTGQSLEDVAKDYARMPEGVAKWAVEHNKSMNFINLATYKHIQALEEQGKTQEAMALAQGKWRDALNQQTKDVGLLASGWQSVSKWASSAFDSMKKMFGPELDEDRLKKLKDNLSFFEGKNKQYGRAVYETDSVKKSIDEIEQKIKKAADDAAQTASNAQTQKAGIDADQRIEKLRQNVDKAYALKKELQQVELDFKAVAAAGSPVSAELQKKILDGVRDKYKEAISPAVKEYENLIKSIRESIASTDAQLASTTKLTPAEQMRAKVLEQIKDGYLKLGPAQKASVEALLNEAVAKERLQAVIEKNRQESEKLLGGIVRSTEATNDQAAAIERQVEVYGLGKDAITELMIVELERQRMSLEQTDNVIPGVIDAINRQIDALNRLRKAQSALEAKDENKKAVESMAKEYKRLSDDIERSLTDALLKGFKNGKSAFSSFGQYIKDYFKALVIKVAVQPVLGAIAGGVAGLLLPGAASAAGFADPTGGFGGLGGIGAIAGLKSAFDAFTGFLSEGGFQQRISIGALDLGTALQKLGGPFESFGKTLIENNGAIGKFGLYAGYAANALSAFSALKDGRYGSAIGTGIGSIAFGPIGGAIGGYLGGLVDSAFGGGGADQIGGQQSGRYTASGELTAYLNTTKRIGGSAGDQNRLNDQFVDPVKTFAKTVGDTLKQLGVSFKEINTALAANFDPGGDSPTQGNVLLNIDGRDVYAKHTNNFSRDQEEFKKQFAIEQSKALIEAIKSSNLATKYRDAFNSATADTVSGIVATVQAVKAFDDAVQRIGGNLAALSGLSLQAEESFLASAGGLDSFTSAVNFLYQNFDTAENNLKRQSDALQAQLNSLGVGFIKTKDQYFSYVKSIDLTTDAGRGLYQSMLALAPTFASVTGAVQATVSSISQEIERLTNAVPSSDGASNPALAQTQFAITLAQAQSGDQTALQRLAGLSQAYESSVAENATSSLQVASARAYLIDSLSKVQAIPRFAAGGDYMGGAALVGEEGPEIINFSSPGKVYTANQTKKMLSGDGSSTDTATADEVKALRQDMRAAFTQIATIEKTMLKVFERWDVNGLPETRVIA